MSSETPCNINAQRCGAGQRSRRQAGMSLVEVFVALLVLSVGLIALAKLQVDLVRSGGDSRARTADYRQ